MSMSTEGPDDALVDEAARLLGTTGRAATIDRALAGVITEHRRRAAVEAEGRRLAPDDPRQAGAAPGAGPRPDPGAEGPRRPARPPDGWLLDTSAATGAHEPAVAAGLRALLAAGRLATCPLLDLEALAGAGDRHRELLARRHLAYRRVPVDDAVTGRALALQATLGEASAGATSRSLLLVATAAVHRLGVLHEDAGLGAVAAAGAVPQQRVSTLRDGGAS
jgi:predicted nucleic acid-binding protein